MAPSTAVVYLARYPDGELAFRRFAESYRKHPAELDHNLIIIYKGFNAQADLDSARACFNGIPHEGIELKDTGFDIGSYWQVAVRIPQRYVVFFNTHSNIRCGGWLRYLHMHGSLDRVGLVGTTGSYESLRTTIQYFEAAIHASLTATGRRAENLASYFDFLLPRFRPDWYASDGHKRDPIRRLHAYVTATGFRSRSRRLQRLGSLRGSALIWPGAPEFDTNAFPSFPNPHVRSNGFMIERERFIALAAADFQSKTEANLFESGANSMTARLRRSGLETMLVGSDGRSYSIKMWPKSRTFRLLDQSNLLVEDNHSRAFIAMSGGGRALHTLISWGEYVALPRDIPSLGLTFGRASLDAID